MGPNGSGKSTLAHVLAGKADYKVTQGQVLFDGEDMLAHGAATSAPPRAFSWPSSIRWKFPASPP